MLNCMQLFSVCVCVLCLSVSVSSYFFPKMYSYLILSLHFIKKDLTIQIGSREMIVQYFSKGELR